MDEGTYTGYVICKIVGGEQKYINLNTCRSKPHRAWSAFLNSRPEYSGAGYASFKKMKREEGYRAVYFKMDITTR